MLGAVLKSVMPSNPILKFVIAPDVKTTAVESLTWIITGGRQQGWVQKRLKLKAICNFAKLARLLH